MRLALIQGQTLEGLPPVYPLGLCYLASVLGPEHEPHILDLNLMPGGLEELKGRLVALAPDVVGLSLRNVKEVLPGRHCSSVDIHRETIRAIAEVKGDAPLVLGGSGFSLYAMPIMERCAEIDIGVRGEGEIAFPQLLGSLNDPAGISGVLFRGEDGSVVDQGIAEPPDFSRLPWPRRDQVPLKPYQKHISSIGIMTKRGCVHRCIHCSDRFLLGETVRQRDPESVLDELESLISQGLDAFMFADQLFNRPQEHAVAICEGIIRRKLSARWSAWFDEKGMTPRFARLLREAGCVLVSFSPDSASNRVLERLGKEAREKDLDATLFALKGSGLQVEYSFFLNGPGETLISVAKTMAFLLRAKRHLRSQLQLGGLLMVPMRIYPHTELRALAIREGIIQEEDDLLDPTFYDPFPLRLLSRSIFTALALAWRIKRALFRHRRGR